MAQAQSTDRVGTAMTCTRCGKPIVLVADDGGVVVPDRRAFLATHRDCLADATRDVQVRIPRQRRSSRSDPGAPGTV